MRKSCSGKHCNQATPEMIQVCTIQNCRYPATPGGQYNTCKHHNDKYRKNGSNWVNLLKDLGKDILI